MLGLFRARGQVMYEAPFGSARRIARGRIDDTLGPGDKVLIVGGRMYGGKATIEAIEDVPTPSGMTVRIIRLRRPRAGIAWEFPDMIERAP